MSELIDSIVNETRANLSAYVEFLINSSSAVLLEKMERYVRDKVYNTVFGDMVPLMISNAFNINLLIITKTDLGHSFDMIKPCRAVGARDRKNVLLYKELDHYDAIVKSKFIDSRSNFALIEHHAKSYPTVTSAGLSI